MQHTIIKALFATAAIAGAVEAQAQVDQFSLNFQKIRFEYRADHSGDLPFSLDIVHGNQGEVVLRPIGTHNLTFKRGQFYPADPLPQAWLGYELQPKRGGGTGYLTLAVDQSGAGSGGGPTVKVFSGGSATSPSLHASGAQFAFGDGSVRFLRDSIGVTLRGEPAALFNRPGPGEELVATLPEPAPGQTLSLELLVMDDRGARTSLPVRITRMP